VKKEEKKITGEPWEPGEQSGSMGERLIIKRLGVRGRMFTGWIHRRGPDGMSSENGETMVWKMPWVQLK